MQKVWYAGESFTTTDYVADTLFKYVAVMDRHGFGESVKLPTIDGDGERGSVRLLVWAGSEIIAREIAPAGDDPDLDVSELRHRADGRSAYKQSRTPQSPEWSADSLDIETV